MRCPTCRRPADAGASTCGRCATSLADLHGLERDRQASLSRAKAALRDIRLDDAEQAIERVCDIRRDGESARSQALLSLLRRDFPQALRWYVRAKMGASAS